MGDITESVSWVGLPEGNETWAREEHFTERVGGGGGGGVKSM